MSIIVLYFSFTYMLYLHALINSMESKKLNFQDLSTLHTHKLITCSDYLSTNVKDPEMAG